MYRSDAVSAGTFTFVRYSEVYVIAGVVIARSDLYAVSVHGACGGRMQPTRLRSNKACSAVVEKSSRAEPNSADFYV